MTPACEGHKLGSSNEALRQMTSGISKSLQFFSFDPFPIRCWEKEPETKLGSSFKYLPERKAKGGNHVQLKSSYSKHNHSGK